MNDNHPLWTVKLTRRVIAATRWMGRHRRGSAVAVLLWAFAASAAAMATLDRWMPNGGWPLGLALFIVGGFMLSHVLRGWVERR